MRNINKVNNLSSCYIFSLGVMLMSLSLLLFTGCEIMSDSSDPEDSSNPELDLSQVSGFKVSASGKCQLVPDFFPLEVGIEWTYKLVHADVDTSWEHFGFPKDFSATVVDTLTVDGKKYYLVENYFLPGGLLPDPAPMRKEGTRVYVRIEEEDHLMYSFAPEDTLWSMPLYVNPTWLVPREAKRAVFTEEAAVVSWDLIGFPGPSPIPGDAESGWGDVLNRGLGRVRIVSLSQANGLTVWDLKEIRTKNNSNDLIGLIDLIPIIVVPLDSFAVYYDNLPKDTVTILSGEIQDSTLKLKVEYLGGCGEHTFELLASHELYYSNPPQLVVYLGHDGGNDSCKENINDLLFFNLQPLRESSQKGPGPGTVVIRLHGYEAYSFGDRSMWLCY